MHGNNIKNKIPIKFAWKLNWTIFQRAHNFSIWFVTYFYFFFPEKHYKIGQRCRKNLNQKLCLVAERSLPAGCGSTNLRWKHYSPTESLNKHVVRWARAHTHTPPAASNERPGESEGERERAWESARERGKEGESEWKIIQSAILCDVSPVRDTLTHCRRFITAPVVWLVQLAAARSFMAARILLFDFSVFMCMCVFFGCLGDGGGIVVVVVVVSLWLMHLIFIH